MFALRITKTDALTEAGKAQITQHSKCRPTFPVRSKREFRTNIEIKVAFQLLAFRKATQTRIAHLVRSGTLTSENRKDLHVWFIRPLIWFKVGGSRSFGLGVDRKYQVRRPIQTFKFEFEFEYHLSDDFPLLVLSFCHLVHSFSVSITFLSSFFVRMALTDDASHLRIICLCVVRITRFGSLIIINHSFWPLRIAFSFLRICFISRATESELTCLSNALIINLISVADFGNHKSLAPSLLAFCSWPASQIDKVHWLNMQNECIGRSRAFPCRHLSSSDGRPPLCRARPHRFWSPASLESDRPEPCLIDINANSFTLLSTTNRPTPSFRIRSRLKRRDWSMPFACQSLCTPNRYSTCAQVNFDVALQHSTFANSIHISISSCVDLEMFFSHKWLSEAQRHYAFVFFEISFFYFFFFIQQTLTSTS